MKSLTIWLLMVTIVFGQAPSEVLKSFNWPKEVKNQMEVCTTYPGKRIALSEDRQPLQGYDVVHQKVQDDIVLLAGSVVDVWRCELDEESYFLLTDGPGWYWTTTSDEPMTDSFETEFSCENKFKLKQQFSYWDANYSDRIAGSRYSVYKDVSIVSSGSLGKWVLSPGIGLSVRYKPMREIKSETKMIPMYRARISLDGNAKLFHSEWLAYQWYSAGSYYQPFDKNIDDSWELYSKFSWRLPRFVGISSKVNFIYYSSQPSTKEWEYGEGKIQILFSHEAIPYIYLGIEPYVSANWSNDDGWVTHSESEPGNIVMIVSSEDMWLEVSYGVYHKKSGIAPVIRHEGNENHLSFTFGTKVLRR